VDKDSSYVVEFVCLGVHKKFEFTSAVTYNTSTTPIHKHPRKMSTTLYTGPTGCGKTFKAITDAKSFVIAVPCRQLAYEIYWDYPQIERIDTGEVHMGNASGNHVCVYENLTGDVVTQDTLIIDEAHYINDVDRGRDLYDKILKNKQAGKNIILLTATDTLSSVVKRDLSVKEVRLKPFGSAPKKKEVSPHVFAKKVEGGMSAIVFTKYTPDQTSIWHYAQAFGIEQESIGMLSANTPSYDRVKTQLDFKQGKLQVVIATNVLAQGLNFPAQGVLIKYNQYDDWEVITQKIGRVARPLSGLKEGYYCLQVMPQKEKKVGLPPRSYRQAKVYFRPSGKKVDIAQWGFSQHEVPSGLANYKEFKYGSRFLRVLQDKLGPLEPQELQAIEFLYRQSELLEELLKSR